MCDNCPSTEEILQMEIQSLKEEMKQLKNFLTGVPAPEFYGYQETENGYKLVVNAKDSDIKNRADELLELERTGKISLAEYDRLMEKVPFEVLGLNALFKYTYSARVRNLIPDEVSIVNRLKFKKDKK